MHVSQAEIQIGANIPLSVYVVTFVMGYFTLLFAYRQRGRTEDWRKRDFFDKTVESFTLGGCMTLLGITLLSLLGMPNLLQYEGFLQALPLLILFDSYMVGFFSILISFFIPKKTRRRKRKRATT